MGKFNCLLFVPHRPSDLSRILKTDCLDYSLPILKLLFSVMSGSYPISHKNRNSGHSKENKQEFYRAKTDLVGKIKGGFFQKNHNFEFYNNFDPPQRCLVVEPDESEIFKDFVMVDQDINFVTKKWPKFISPIIDRFKEHYCDIQNFDPSDWIPDDYNRYEFELFQKWEKELIVPDQILARTFLFTSNPIRAYFLRNRVCFWVDLKTHLLRYCKDVHHASTFRDAPSFSIRRLYTQSKPFCIKDADNLDFSNDTYEAERPIRNIVRDLYKEPKKKFKPKVFISRKQLEERAALLARCKKDFEKNLSKFREEQRDFKTKWKYPQGFSSAMFGGPTDPSIFEKLNRMSDDLHKMASQGIEHNVNFGQGLFDKILAYICSEEFRTPFLISFIVSLQVADTYLLAKRGSSDPFLLMLIAVCSYYVAVNYHSNPFVTYWTRLNNYFVALKMGGYILRRSVNIGMFAFMRTTVEVNLPSDDKVEIEDPDVKVKDPQSNTLSSDETQTEVDMTPDNPIIRDLVMSIIGLLYIACFAVAPKGDTITVFLTRFEKMMKADRSVQTLVTFIANAFNRILQVFTDPSSLSFRLKISPFPELERMAAKADIVLEMFRKGADFNQDNALLVHEVNDDLTRFIYNLPKFEGYVQYREKAQQMQRTLQPIVDRLSRTFYDQSGPRIVPTCFGFFGPTGAGKSTLLLYLTLRVLVGSKTIPDEIKRRVLRDIKSELYPIFPGMKYFNAFRGQKIMIIDELGAILSSKSAPAEELLILLRLVNILPYFPDMADLIDKGCRPANPYFVLLTSNKTHLDYEEAACPAAIARRIDASFCPTPNAGLCDRKSSLGITTPELWSRRFDYKKLSDYLDSDEDPFDVNEFFHWNASGANTGPEREIRKETYGHAISEKPLNTEELISFMIETHDNKHYAAQRVLDNYDKVIKSMSESLGVEDDPVLYHNPFSKKEIPKHSESAFKDIAEEFKRKAKKDISVLGISDFKYSVAPIVPIKIKEDFSKRFHLMEIRLGRSLTKDEFSTLQHIFETDKTLTLDENKNQLYVFIAGKRKYLPNLINIIPLFSNIDKTYHRQDFDSLVSKAKIRNQLLSRDAQELLGISVKETQGRSLYSTISTQDNTPWWERLLYYPTKFLSWAFGLYNDLKPQIENNKNFETGLATRRTNLGSCLTAAEHSIAEKMQDAYEELEESGFFMRDENVAEIISSKPHFANMSVESYRLMIYEMYRKKRSDAHTYLKGKVDDIWLDYASDLQDHIERFNLKPNVAALAWFSIMKHKASVQMMNLSHKAKSSSIWQLTKCIIFQTSYDGVPYWDDITEFLSRNKWWIACSAALVGLSFIGFGFLAKFLSKESQDSLKTLEKEAQGYERAKPTRAPSRPVKPPNIPKPSAVPKASQGVNTMGAMDTIRAVETNNWYALTAAVYKEGVLYAEEQIGHLLFVADTIAASCHHVIDIIHSHYEKYKDTTTTVHLKGTRPSGGAVLWSIDYTEIIENLYCPSVMINDKDVSSQDLIFIKFPRSVRMHTNLISKNRFMNSILDQNQRTDRAFFRYYDKDGAHTWDDLPYWFEYVSTRDKEEIGAYLAFSYSKPTRKGDSGTPVFIATTNHTYIGGIHSSGDGQTGSAIPLMKHVVDNALDYFGVTPLVIKEVQGLPFPNENLIPSHMEVVGRAPPIFIPRKTDIRASRLQQELRDVYHPTTFPARLRDDPEKDYFPLRRARERFGKISNSFDPKVFKMAEDMQNKKYFSQHRATEIPRIWTYREAIMGIEGRRSGMKMSSSPGFPFKHLYGETKKTIWGSRKDGTFNLDTLIARLYEAHVMEVLERMCSGEVIRFVFTDFLKDETIRPGKDPRMFCAGPMTFLIIQVMLFGSLCEFLKLNRIHNGFLIGINPFGEEWNVLGHDRNRFDKHVPMDIKCFDGTLKSQLTQSFLSTSNLYYKHHIDEKYIVAQKVSVQVVSFSHHLAVFSEDELSDSQKESYKTLEFIEDEKVNMPINILPVMPGSVGIVVRVNQCTPSGQLKTGEMNTDSNLKQNNVIDLMLQKKFLGYYDPDELSRNVSNVAYGDDIIKSVKEPYSFITLTSVQEAFSNFGIEVTSDVKGETGVEHKSLDKLTILQRSIIKDIYSCGKYIAPLGLKSILDPLMWEDKNLNMTDRALLYQQQIYELSYHEKQTFDYYVPPIVRAVFETYNIRLLHIEYFECRSIAMNLENPYL